MKNILLHPKLKTKISKEVGVSKQTVDMSLNYVFNSDKAKIIRSKAKELLQTEIDNIIKNEESEN